ncbi:MAG TPA: D-amino acid dehydrogenase [Steroidobacteraceae bacterium]|nr:D-amino acid dehydrogenase [Steroidobacteraceae bacterium]
MVHATIRIGQYEERMVQRPHVIVVGAGLAGLATAYYLQRDGARVTVVDRAGGPGLETSFANGALLHASLVEPWNSPGVLWQILRWLGHEHAPMLLRPRAIPGLLSWGPRFILNSTRRRYDANTQKNLRLAIFSLGLMRRLRIETPISYQYQSRGVLAVFRTATLQTLALRRCEELGRHGLSFRPLQRDALIDLEPALGPIGERLVGGIHYGTDEGGDAHQFCVELARVLKEGGAELRFGTAVDAIHHAKGRIHHLVCGGEEMAADSYVLAAGSYTPLLARHVGLSLPVRPAKGYSITMPRSRAPAAAPRIGVADAHLHAVVVPVGDDRVRVAGTAELTGYDLSIHPQRIENLKELLRRMFPAFAAQLQEGDFTPWAGLRPMSADGVPILGATRLSNLYLNTGHGHLGWTLAAGSGRLVADVIARRAPALNMRDFELARPL